MFFPVCVCENRSGIQKSRADEMRTAAVTNETSIPMQRCSWLMNSRRIDASNTLAQGARGESMVGISTKYFGLFVGGFCMFR